MTTTIHLPSLISGLFRSSVKTAEPLSTTERKLPDGTTVRRTRGYLEPGTPEWERVRAQRQAARDRQLQQQIAERRRQREMPASGNGMTQAVTVTPASGAQLKEIPNAGSQLSPSASRSSPVPIETAFTPESVYSRQMDAAQAARDRRQEALDAASATPQPLPSVDGRLNSDPQSTNDDYNSLPDVVARRNAALLERQKQEYLASQKDVIQPKSVAQTMQDHDGYKSWGDRLVSGQMAREEGKSTGAILRNGFKDFAEDFAHDTLNNWNIYANNVEQGAREIGHLAKTYLNPTNWGSSAEAIKRRASHANDAANDRRAALERDRRILDSMNTGLGSSEVAGDRGVSGGDKFLSRLNYGMMNGIGQFVGGELATAGIGGIAKGVSTALKAPVGAVARTAGSAVTRGANALGGTRAVKAIDRVTTPVMRPVAERMRYIGSGFGERAQNLEKYRSQLVGQYNAAGLPLNPDLATRNAFRHAYARGMGGNLGQRQMWSSIAGHEVPGTLPQRLGARVRKGVEEVGNTLAAPTDLIHRLSRPVTRLGESPTVQAALNPAVQVLRGVRHPVQMARTLYGAGRFAAQHPGQAVRRVAASPFRYGWSVAKPAVKGTKKTVLSMPAFRGAAMWDAYRNASDGNYGRAAADIGTMGAWGAGVLPGVASTAATAYAFPEEDQE